jgi:catalase
MNQEVNMFEKNKLTNNVGAPVADNQNVMTTGHGFFAKRGVTLFLRSFKSPIVNKINR